MTSPSSPRLRVLLADDHVLLRQGLRAILQQEGFRVVGEAPDGHTAIKMCIILQPEIAILDLGMPLLNGMAISDRKSTRLNSSHGYISYAVFCLKKKKNCQ